jgi:hypothetical protein
MCGTSFFYIDKLLILSFNPLRLFPVRYLSFKRPFII